MYKPRGLYTGVDGLAIKYTVCHTLFLHESCIFAWPGGSEKGFSFGGILIRKRGARIFLGGRKKWVGGINADSPETRL